MESLTLNQANSRMPLRLLQVTDPHLFEGEETALLGVETLASFRAVLRQIQNDNEPLDLILATGDLSQDDSARSYTRFAEEIGVFDTPCVWLPGNHDDKAVMAENLCGPNLHSAKQILTEHWQILMLDSQMAGYAKGYLAPKELAEMEACLQEHPKKHTLICVHHHPIKVGSSWLDQHILANGAEFLEVLSRYPSVKAVIWGHVHQDCEHKHNGISLIATPSTCIQFKPNSNAFALDQVSPGYRYLTLHPDGRFEHQLRRLDGDLFLPVQDASGY